MRSNPSFGLVPRFFTAGMLVPQGFKEVAAYHLTLRSSALLVSSFLSDMATLLAGIVVIFALCNRIAQIIINTQFDQQRALNVQLTHIIAKISSIVFSEILVLEGFPAGHPVKTIR